MTQALAKSSIWSARGLLTRPTKQVFEDVLEEEMSEHVGYDRPDRSKQRHSRNGVRSKTVLTEMGPVEIDVPRDTDASFQPQIVRKRQRRLTAVAEMVLSLTSRGLTTGEISANLAEVYAPRSARRRSPRSCQQVLDGLGVGVLGGEQR